jgi:hypothetical protein
MINLTMNPIRISLTRDAVVRNLCLMSYAEWEAVKKFHVTSLIICSKHI